MAILTGYGKPWGVAGGWAIDLHLGKETRVHGDIEIAVFRDDQGILKQHLNGFTFRKVVEGKLEGWEDEELSLPVHELHASNGEEEVEVLLNEVKNGQWIFRRNPEIAFPQNRLICHAENGIPYLHPVVVLLYKAKHMRENDQQDFMSVKDRLNEEDRLWLLNALELHLPHHQWIKELGGIHR